MICLLCGYRTSDEFFQQLEDNQVMLSTIKASRHVKAFEKEVSHCYIPLCIPPSIYSLTYTGGSMGEDIVTYTGSDRDDSSSPKTMDVLRG